MTKAIHKTSLFLAVLLFNISAIPVTGQSEPVGPGAGKFENNFISGEFINWDRKATPMLVLRVHGAGSLQTFAEISSTGEFNIPLPEIPAAGNYGSMNCGDLTNGFIVVVSDFSLLTTLEGFSSPGRWDKGYSVIGMALFADEKFSKNIGKPGGRRASWLYSKIPRTVKAGKCNNINSFDLNAGWNAFTIVSGQSGGPHTYKPGLDSDLGWYWYAFPENIPNNDPLNQNEVDEESDKNLTDGAEVKADWLIGNWLGIQQDVQIEMHLQSSGDVWLESIEGGHKKTLEGKWTLNKNEFILDIIEGVLHFNIERLSDSGFRLFGKDAGSEIVFSRKE
jgi:hypothetical protein